MKIAIKAKKSKDRQGSRTDKEPSYTVKFNFNLNLDGSSNAFKRTTKLIIYTSDLSKTHSTQDIHKLSSIAIVSLNESDKEKGEFTFTNKVSTVNVLHHITHLSSNNTNPFKIDEDIDIKAHYKATPNDNGYKEVKFAYAIAKTDKFNELVKKEPTGVVNLKDKVATINSEQESKDIIFNPSKDIKDEKELQKLKEGNHSLVIFAYLQDKQASSTKSNDPEYTPAFKTNYGKTHIRFDFKIPMYLEFTGSKLIIYEFEDMDEDNIFGAGVNARLSDKECYINSGLNKGNDDTRRFKYYPLRIKAYVLSTISKRHW